MLWNEFLTANGTEVLFAPIKSAESHEDPLYRFIQREEEVKVSNELTRLLYVATTRAKKELHLLGSARYFEKHALVKPQSGSLLDKLWPCVSYAFPDNPEESSENVDTESVETRDYSNPLIRIEKQAGISLPDWKDEQFASNETVEYVPQLNSRLTAQLTGTLIHRILQAAVIPAKAGIQSCNIKRLDPRFRGGDGSPDSAVKQQNDKHVNQAEYIHKAFLTEA